MFKIYIAEDDKPLVELLDVNLPKYDGYYCCRQIRNLSTCPIVFLSAREGKMDQVMAAEGPRDRRYTACRHPRESNDHRRRSGGFVLRAGGQ